MAIAAQKQSHISWVYRLEAATGADVSATLLMMLGQAEQYGTYRRSQPSRHEFENSSFFDLSCEKVGLFP